MRSRFHDIAARLGLSLDDLPWVPTDDGDILDGGRLVCILADDAELPDLALILAAPLLARLVVELAVEVAAARGLAFPEWASGRAITTAAITPLEQAKLVIDLLDQHQ